MKRIGIAVVAIGLLIIAIACADPEQVELAKMRHADSLARLASAQAQGTVNVIEAQTNAHIEKLRVENDITLEKREAELQLARDKLRLHREEMASILEEGEALIVALQANAAIAENSRLAAENSWWAVTIPTISNFLVALCTLGLGYYLYRDLRGRID